jgi:hypothetical protein
VLQGNKVGFNVPGDAAMGNAGFGISIDAAPGTVIGGSQAGQGNLIGASGADGIAILNGAASTVVQGNSIGNDGTLNRGNGGAGVNIADGSNTVVGGDAPGEANTIAFNGAAGISVAPLATNVSNTFASNTWRDNAGLAIDLGADGGTANDGPGDADTGANGLQNFPDLVLTATNTDTLVHVDLQSALQSKFVIRFYLVSSCDARLFSHSPFDPATIVEVTTNSDGFGSRDVTLPIQLTGLQGIAATATDPAGNTSEISACGQFSVAPLAGAFSTQPSAPAAAISRERWERR